jgi:hypothetical protein
MFAAVCRPGLRHLNALFVKVCPRSISNGGHPRRRTDLLINDRPMKTTASKHSFNAPPLH